LSKRLSCAKNEWSDLNDLYTVWRVFAQGVAVWWSRRLHTCVKIFSGAGC